MELLTAKLVYTLWEIDGDWREHINAAGPSLRTIMIPGLRAFSANDDIYDALLLDIITFQTRLNCTVDVRTSVGD